MKIISKSLNRIEKNLKTINLNPKLQDVHKVKYLPSFSKEWKNIIYSFNKNNLRNLGSNTLNINKIIKSYFNLFFKHPKYLGKTKFRYLKKRRNFLRKIYVSNAEIKYTNNKAKVILYTVNKEKKALKRKYFWLRQKITYNLINKLNQYYSDIIKNSYLNTQVLSSKKIQFLFTLMPFLLKEDYLRYKLKYLQGVYNLSRLLLKRSLSRLLKDESFKFLKYLRKYDLLYSLNTHKFNKLKLLSKLSYLLQKIIGKKLEYTIINLKSIAYHPDIFTSLLGLKIKRDKFKPRRRIQYVLHKSKILKNNTIQERSKTQRWDKTDNYKNQFKDLKIISHINKDSSLSNLLNNINVSNHEGASSKNDIFNFIFNSIKYKNLAGVRIKVSGRLTKRYRADRAIRTLKWKGGLKNIDSSFRGLSTVTFRGNTHSNVSYSWFKSKRRIGSFAVKGWIAGK
jgi:hypothetical protein